MSLINNILIYFEYRKNLKKCLPHLKSKYGFSKNIFNEFYTVLDLNDVPRTVIEEYGNYWREHEIQNFLLLIQREVAKYNITEELGILEIKKINDNVFGICFGIKQSIFKPRFFIYSLILSIITLSLTTLIILL